MDPANVNLVSPTTAESARSVRQEHSGAPHPINASLYVDKIPHTLPQPVHASAIQGLDSSTVPVRHVRRDTSYQRGIVLHVPSTLSTIPSRKDATALLDSLRINGVYVLENADQMRSTTQSLRPVPVYRD